VLSLLVSQKHAARLIQLAISQFLPFQLHSSLISDSRDLRFLSEHGESRLFLQLGKL
jgi:hypothetical protein